MFVGGLSERSMMGIIAIYDMPPRFLTRGGRICFCLCQCPRQTVPL